MRGKGEGEDGRGRVIIGLEVERGQRSSLRMVDLAS